MAVEYAETSANSERSAPEICAEGVGIAGNFCELTTDITFVAASSLVDVKATVPKGVSGIYSFYDANTDLSYVGRSNDIRRRLLEHIRQGLRAIDPSKGVKILEFEEGLGSDIANVEQLAIRDCGGVAGLSNSINAVADRQDLEALYDTLGAFLGR